MTCYWVERATWLITLPPARRHSCMPGQLPTTPLSFLPGQRRTNSIVNQLHSRRHRSLRQQCSCNELDGRCRCSSSPHPECGGTADQCLTALPPGLKSSADYFPHRQPIRFERTDLAVAVSATDPNHYPLTYSAAPLPAGASFKLLKRARSPGYPPPPVGNLSHLRSCQGQSGQRAASITVTVSVVETYWTGRQLLEVERWRGNDRRRFRGLARGPCPTFPHPGGRG